MLIEKKKLQEENYFFPSSHLHYSCSQTYHSLFICYLFMHVHSHLKSVENKNEHLIQFILSLQFPPSFFKLMLLQSVDDLMMVLSSLLCWSFLCSGFAVILVCNLGRTLGPEHLGPRTVTLKFLWIFPDFSSCS